MGKTPFFLKVDVRFFKRFFSKISINKLKTISIYPHPITFSHASSELLLFDIKVDYIYLFPQILYKLLKRKHYGPDSYMRGS